MEISSLTKINVNEKAHVVAGFLSPSHDSYVNHKLHNTDFESGILSTL